VKPDVALVARVIQCGYQDATTSVLDALVAEDIVAALREAGWATPGEVATIVAAAGGRVEVSERCATDPPATLTRWYRPDTFSTIFTTAAVGP
jgi:hypothetical protein